ncbi:unnamed protein product [Soboliphyme baturini]|uniref:Apple domain-containing protein n=1 Tax=Soboliphyme baturini TaxID=241478 RepID=A0A183IUB1_9BILA|nr:unnamed protein product [Soboliphyme baturini]
MMHGDCADFIPFVETTFSIDCVKQPLRGPHINRDSCLDYCRNTLGCRAFTHNGQFGLCQLFFDKSVEAGGICRREHNTDWILFERSDCYKRILEPCDTFLTSTTSALLNCGIGLAVKDSITSAGECRSLCTQRSWCQAVVHDHAGICIGYSYSTKSHFGSRCTLTHNDYSDLGCNFEHDANENHVPVEQPFLHGQVTTSTCVLRPTGVARQVCPVRPSVISARLATTCFVADGDSRQMVGRSDATAVDDGDDDDATVTGHEQVTSSEEEQRRTEKTPGNAMQPSGRTVPE